MQNILSCELVHLRKESCYFMDEKGRHGGQGLVLECTGHHPHLSQCALACIVSKGFERDLLFLAQNVHLVGSTVLIFHCDSLEKMQNLNKALI